MQSGTDILTSGDVVSKRSTHGAQRIVVAYSSRQAETLRRTFSLAAGTGGVIDLKVTVSSRRRSYPRIILSLAVFGALPKATSTDSLMA